MIVVICLSTSAVLVMQVFAFWFCSVISTMITVLSLCFCFMGPTALSTWIDTLVMP